MVLMIQLLIFLRILLSSYSVFGWRLLVLESRVLILQSKPTFVVKILVLLH